MILMKTLDGHRVLKDRSVRLTPHQRSAFILVDGKKTVEQILAATRAAGVTQADIDRLLELGLVEKPLFAAAVENAAKLEAKRGGRSLEEKFQEAYEIATMLTANLGLRGYRLNLAVEQATNYMELSALAPRIREAVGDDSYEMLERALND
jgi:hypothetical protein